MAFYITFNPKPTFSHSEMPWQFNINYDMFDVIRLWPGKRPTFNMYTRTHACTHGRMHARTHARTHIHIYIYTHEQTKLIYNREIIF